MKRDHANLCSYNPKQNVAKASTGSVAGIKKPRSPGSETSLKKDEDRWPRTTGKLFISLLPVMDYHGIFDQSRRLHLPINGRLELASVDLVVTLYRTAASSRGFLFESLVTRTTHVHEYFRQNCD